MQKKKYKKEYKKCCLIICYLYCVCFSPMDHLFIYFFTKMGSHCIYGTISFFHLCAVVSLFWLEIFPVCLPGIGFEAFIALTLVHGVETLKPSLLVLQAYSVPNNSFRTHF